MAAVNEGVVLQLRPAPEHRPRLELLRNTAELTRRELANELGVPALTVRRYEDGRERIPCRHREQLAELFDVSVPFLMGEELAW